MSHVAVHPLVSALFIRICLYLLVVVIAGFLAWAIAEAELRDRRRPRRPARRWSWSEPSYRRRPYDWERDR